MGCGSLSGPEGVRETGGDAWPVREWVEWTGARVPVNVVGEVNVVVAVDLEYECLSSPLGSEAQEEKEGGGFFGHDSTFVVELGASTTLPVYREGE